LAQALPVGAPLLGPPTGVERSKIAASLAVAMSAAGRAESAPPGKSASATDVLSPKNNNVYDEDDPILMTLKRPPVKKRNPAAKFDGRVSNMSLQEYRERKWSVDACYAKMERRGPAFSMRRMVPRSDSLGKKNTNFCNGDPVGAFNSLLRHAPECTMAPKFFNPPKELSQGPAEYAIPSSMDPFPHPTIGKNNGARFGSEVLQPRDPTGPAPGDYDPDAIDKSSTLKKQPNFSIQGREAWRPPQAAPGPGVGEYKYETSTRVGKMTPLRYTMAGKTEPLARPLGARQYQLPGPPHYKPPDAWHKDHPMKQAAPVWKFGSEARGLRS